VNTSEKRILFDRLEELSRFAKADILTMTYLAGSGHPGGAISSLDIFLTVFSFANLKSDPRDRIVVSHGHTSAGVYAALGRLGLIPIEDAIAFFRKAGSPFEGHVVTAVPFIDWSTGNLGQGLSAACGLALSSSILKRPSHVYVIMSDGEQQKGQVAEARRFAKKYGLSHITAIIDFNGLQITGKVDEVMPVNVVEDYLTEGWDVLEVDGHNHKEIYEALEKAKEGPNPACIIARTVMGKGIPFMEGKEKYHGTPLKDEEYVEALRLLGVEDRRDFYRQRRSRPFYLELKEVDTCPLIDEGVPFTYTNDDGVDNRTAFGRALLDLGRRNIKRGVPICVFDCDLAQSVKTLDFSKEFPGFFFQGGIQEHNTATVAGALSREGVLTFFADFGVFGLDETFNQHRLNDMNGTNLKLILTHLGLDVGQDGKTHQCIDYVGLARNLLHFKVIIPCDPNQTDRVTRFVARQKGNFIVGMGRSRWPVIEREDGRPFFAPPYEFVYGRMDVIREGKDGAIIAYGATVARAIKVRQMLRRDGIELMVVNMACVKEIDEDVMERLMELPFIATYEDHIVYSGIAPFLSLYLLKKGYRGRLETFGVKNYGLSGEPDEIMRAEGLDEESVVEAIRNVLE